MALDRSSPTISISLFLLLAVASSALGQDASPTFDWQVGSGWADIGVNLAEVTLTDRYIYLDGDETRKLMQYAENPISDQEVATIAPASVDEAWFVVFEWDPIGYVKDEGHEDLDADAILRSLRDGTEAANEIRRQRGWAPLTLVGWQTSPFYDTRTNNLTWAILGESEGYRSLNHSIRLLGRKGVMNVTVVASPEEFAGAVSETDRILDDFRFKPGNRYGEFVAGSDRVAEIGLAALITGGAAAAAVKTGLFARLWKFLAAGVIALLAGLKRLFTRGGGSRAKT